MDLSVVFGTHNRLQFLLDCIGAIRSSVGDLKYEIVVVDGGSTDGSREYLAVQQDVVLVGEHVLEGAIKAFNKGFSLTRGWAVANINDDVIVIGDCLKRAYDYLRHFQESVAQVAFIFDVRLSGQFRRGDTVHGCQAANFGMSQKLLGDYVNWWGNTYHTYGGDTECSIKYWEIGWQVHSVGNCKVHHMEVHDALRRPNDAANHFWSVWTPERVAAFPKTPKPRSEIEAEMAKRVRLW
jgi:GT2 family glycosyltransferase